MIENYTGGEHPFATLWSWAISLSHHPRPLPGLTGASPSKELSPVGNGTMRFYCDKDVLSGEISIVSGDCDDILLLITNAFRRRLIGPLQQNPAIACEDRLRGK